MHKCVSGKITSRLFIPSTGFFSTPFMTTTIPVNSTSCKGSHVCMNVSEHIQSVWNHTEIYSSDRAEGLWTEATLSFTVA